MINYPDPYSTFLENNITEFNFSSATVNKLQDKKLKTGTSIIALKKKDTIIMASDLQATAGHMMIEIQHKIVKPIWGIEDNYLLGLAGIAQVITYVIRSLNEFYSWYHRYFLAKPSIDNMIQHLNMLNTRNGWNYHAHIILAGICQRTGEYKAYSLKYGDITYLKQDDCLYAGSGSAYLMAVHKSVKTIESIEQLEQLAINALRVSKAIDLYSGFQSEIFRLNSAGITVKRIKSE